MIILVITTLRTARPHAAASRPSVEKGKQQPRSKMALPAKKQTENMATHLRLPRTDAVAFHLTMETVDSL